MTTPEPRQLPAWAPTAGVAFALAGLVALSFAERWALVSESPFPVGVDGYFYPIQLRSLLETGGLHYPASPLAFWLMLPLAALTDPITGAKLGAALFGALVALPAYGVGARLGRCRGAGLIAAVLATTSAGSAYLTIEFVKNGVGLTVALTAVWLLLRALESPTVWRIALAIGGAILAALAHKMAAGIVLAIAVPALLADRVGRGALRGRRLLYTTGGLLLLAIVAIVVGSLFPERLLSPGDARLVEDLWSSEPHWMAPALERPRATITLGHEALIGGILAIVAAFVLSRSGRTAIADLYRALPREVVGTAPPRGTASETAVGWCFVVLALFIALPWLNVSDGQGLGFRLRIAAFVPMAMAGAVVAGRVFAQLRYRDFVLAAIALLLAARTPGSRTEGRIVAHPAMVAAVAALDGQVPAGDTVIVPERHISFMVAWYTRAQVRIRPDAVPRERRWRLMPLAWIGAGSPLDGMLIIARTHRTLPPPVGLHPRHPDGLVLVAESTWEWILAQLPADVRARWATWPTI